MIIYLAIFCAILAVSVFNHFIKNPKASKIFLFFGLFLIAFVFVGLRGVDNTPDGETYYKLFESIKAMPWGGVFSTKYEFGYVILNKLVSSVGAPYIVFQLVHAFLVWGGLSFFLLTFSEDFSLSFFTLFALALYITMTANRQCLAVSFVSIGLTSFSKIHKKDLAAIIYYLFNLIAISFHTTAALCLVFPVIYWLSLHLSKINILIAISAYFVVLVSCRPLYSFITIYLKTAYSPATNINIPETSILFFTIFLFGAYFLTNSVISKKTNNWFDSFSYKTKFPKQNLDTSAFLTTEKNSIESCRDIHTNQMISIPLHNEMDAFFLMITLLGSFITAFSLVNVVFGRFYYYTLGPISIVIGNSVARQNSKILKTITKVIIPIIMILYFFIALKKSGFWSTLIPYQIFHE